MEWIKQMRLKKSLFAIALANSAIALILSLLSFWGCMKLNSFLAPEGNTLFLYADPVIVAETSDPASPPHEISIFLSVLQIALPALIYTLALFFTSSLFYRLKLQKPLDILTKGASRIMESNLDFTIEADSRDEFGKLCAAFEAMRKELLSNNQKLWRQTQERKRLNAAFSHNLRNPVTVLKGCAKLARQGVLADTIDREQLAEHLSLMENYTDRIQRYVETMSSIQRLEEIPLVRETTPWKDIVAAFENMLRFVGADSGKQIYFETKPWSGTVLVDSSVLFQIGENLVTNALRFAREQVRISCFTDGKLLTLSVTDDGRGFPQSYLQSGIRPFQKGTEDAEHFGMGLYTSRLLAGKHGGIVTLQNSGTGAAVTALLQVN